MNERTVHDICVFHDKSNVLRVKPLTLPYGLYRFTLCVSVIGHDLISAHRDLYIKVGIIKAIFCDNNLRRRIIFPLRLLICQFR